jgi:hypothetical protein
MRQVRIVSSWSFLLSVVPSICVLLLVPKLGEHEQNLLSEVIGASLSDGETFSTFAADASRFGWAMSAVVFTAGLILPFVVLRTWRDRLRPFDAERVMHFRPLFWKHMLSSGAVTAASAMMLMFTAPTLRSVPPLAWTIAAGGSAAAAMAHYVAVSFAFPNVRRLILGR